MKTDAPSSSNSDISSAIKSTKTMEAQSATTDDPSSKPKCLPFPFGVRRSISEPIPNGTVTAATAAATHNDIREHARQVLDLITKDLNHVKTASEELKKYGVFVGNQITEASTKLKSLNDSVNCSGESPPEDTFDTEDLPQEVLELKKKVMKLKLQIPSKYRSHVFAPESDPHKNQRAENSTHGRQDKKNTKKQGRVPNLCKNQLFGGSLEMKDFEALYDSLRDEQKLCLLSFSVFPEKEIIKKRFLLYWWIGEGFVRPIPGSETTAEDLANEVFKELMKKGFIEPFSDKRICAEMSVNKCRMHPFVRAAVVTLADRANFFDFDSEGKPTTGFSSSYRACLLAGKKLEAGQNANKAHMLLNFDREILDFKKPDREIEFEKPEMFSMMKNINILCLGRWQTSPMYHIEVEETKFLEGSKNMKYLKFLSLQGISRIMELPGSILQLPNLTILDIRACHNLEEIPKKIGLLKSLTHLDMSECYLLANMPKELSDLKELQVLKGFVVGNLKGKNWCSIEDLAGLTKLRKLSVYTGQDDFPTETEMRHLYKFKELLKLTIEWGGGSQAKSMAANAKEPKNEINGKPASKQENPDGVETQNRENGTDDVENGANSTPETRKRRNLLKRNPKMRSERDGSEYFPPELPTQLQKLDLQCFPRRYAPGWFKASKLKNLKKLYIRGGTLRDLGQLDWEEKWEWKKVEILRLKFLSELEMDWRELKELFPNLIYLEKVRCSKLTLFPCDEQGVWMKKKTEKSM
ncbi:hypothetical protein U1Q18_010786 [Sarracenia purpurea var. burkii]